MNITINKMSNFIKNTKHPITGEWRDAFWIDDYFGSHRYGVIFCDGDATWEKYDKYNELKGKSVFDTDHFKLETK